MTPSDPRSCRGCSRPISVVTEPTVDAGIEELSLTQLDDGGHECVIRDISERKARADALRREQRFFEAASNSLDHLFDVFDDDLDNVGWNDRFEEVIGYSPSEIRELTPMDLFEGDTKHHCT